jgi:hypothetical protein
LPIACTSPKPIAETTGNHSLSANVLAPFLL